LPKSFVKSFSLSDHLQILIGRVTSRHEPSLLAIELEHIVVGRRGAEQCSLTTPQVGIERLLIQNVGSIQVFFFLVYATVSVLYTAMEVE
jgi:hypothetical protein